VETLISFDYLKVFFGQELVYVKVPASWTAGYVLCDSLPLSE